MLIPKLFHSLPAISVLLLTLILTPRPAWAECWLITDRTGVNRKALCGHNRPPFEYLPMNLNASIVLLNVTGNHLQRLDPKALGRYPVLRRLDLTYNLLSSLPEAAFSALPDLRVLLLGHNQLAHLPGDTFRGLGHLEILGLEANILESVSVTAFLGLSALQDLNLSVNRLAWLPERLLHIFPQLHILRLGGNPLACKCALLPFLLLLHTLPVSLDSETSCYSPPDLAGLPPQRPNPDPTAKMFKSFSRPPAASALERLSLTCPTPVTSPNPVTSPSPPEATTSSTPGFMPVVPMIGRSPDVLEEENNCLPGRCLNTDEKFIDRVMPTAPHPSLELKSVSLKGATLLARIPRPLERFFVLSRYNSGNCIKLRKLSRTFESIPVSDISSEGFTTFCIASVKRSHCLNHTCLKFNSSGAVWPHRSGLGLQISPGEASEEARGQAFFGWGWGNGLAMVAGVVMLVVMLSCVIWRSRRKGDGHDGGTSGIGVMGDRSGTDMTNISATEEEDGVVSKEEEMPTRPQMKSLTPPQRPPPYPLSPSSTKFTSHTPVTSPMPAAATGGYVEVSGHANMASGIESLKSVPHQVEAGITVSSLFSAVPSRTIITSEGSLSPSAQSESGTSQVIMASPPHVMLGRNKGSFGIPATLATMKEPGLDTKDAASLFVDTTPTNRTPFCGAPQIAAISQEVDRVNVIISSCIDALRGSNSSSSGGSGLAGTGSETTVAVPHTSSAPHGFMLLRAEELAALARGPMSQTCSAHPSTSRSVAVPSNTSKIQHNLHLTRGFTSVPESAVSLLPAHSSSSSCLPPCRPPRTPPLLWRDDSQTSLSHPPITHPIEVHPPTAHYHLAQSPSSALPVQALQPSFSPSSPETPSARRAARALWRKLQRVRGRARRDDTHMQVVSKGAGHALKEKVQRARGEDLHEILDYWKGVSAQHT